MPMGLSNSPSVFQRLVSRILGHLYFVEVFMDDILIHSPDAASHLQHIDQKNKQWEWTEAHTDTFNALKAALTSTPVLVPFDPEAQSVFVTDTSKFAIGTALFQVINVKHCPVAYYSRKLIPAEINYTTREQELLAIRDALKVSRHYLASMPIEIHTDHESLKFIQTQPTESLNPRLARWQQYLSQYNFTKNLHIKGKDNVVNSLTGLTSATSSTLADIVTDQGKDPFCKAMITALKKFTNPRDPIRSSFALTPTNTLVWTAKNLERIVVPPEHLAALRKEAHDSPTSAHLGIDKMYNSLAEVYYWPAMHKDVHDYCTSCQS
eukprot:2259117-Rhodomonas_salina.3